MAITRIKNNQITDGTIEAGKIANTTITGGKLENNMTYGSNLTISGNLTVNGTTTTVDSTTTQVADPLLLLSRGATGSASVDAGLVIERGDDDNVAMIWDESADQFIVAVTASEDGTTAGNVTVSSYANLQAGTVTVSALSLTGTFDADNIRIDGNTISSTDTNGAINLTPDGTGEVVASTLTVSDLTDNRVVIAGTSGALEDDANFTYDGTDLTVNSAIVSDLTDNRLVVAGTSGALEDDANLTWDATNLAVTGGVDVTGDLDVDNINVNGNAITSTDTNGNITITPNGTGDLVLDGLNWPQADGTAGYVLKTDGSAQLSWVSVLTDLVFDTTPQLGGDLDVNGQKIVSARSNEDIVLEPNGTGEVVMSTAVVSDLTDNRIVVAGTAGALEDDANLTWDGSDMGVTGGLNVTGDITIDNLDLNGNTISSTDTNGAVNVTPNGTGTIELGGTSTVVNINGTTGSTSSTTGALVVDGGAGIAENLEVGGNIVVAGNLTVEGTTTTVDSVTTQVVDPIFQIGGGSGGAALTTSDSKDRGMSAKYYSGSEKTAFWGFDDSTGYWTFVPDATISGEVVSGSKGTLDVGSILNANLTDNRVVIAGTNGVLEDDANFTFDGTTLALTAAMDITGDLDVDNININGNTIISSDTNGAINITPNGTGEVVLSTAAVSDLTATRVTYAGASGALVDSANMTFDGTDLTVASAVVSDLTDNRIVVAGTSGALEDDANLTWDATNLAVTGGVDVTGDLDVDNININGNTIISTDTNGAINITPNGTGETVISTAAVSDLTSGRVVTAGTSGALEDSASLLWDGTDLTAGSAIVSDLTSGRVVLAGTSGAIEDSGNLTFDGTTLTVTGNIAVDNLDLDGNNITATSGGVVTINDAGADVDFRVEGDTNTGLFVVDAGSDSVSVGTATQTAGATFKVGATDSMMIAVGTTAQRPGTGATGMLRVNTSTNKMEYYADNQWKTADAEFTVIASDTFDGDGSTVAFTLGAEQTTAGCIVSINGIVQLPTTAYGVSSTTLTFTEAPASGDKIEVRRLTTTQTINEVEITANNTTDETTYVTFVDGATGSQGIETDTGLTYNPSSNTLTTTTFSGTATTAQYADLAEQYASDEDIEAGTVVHFAGNGKVAPCDTDACTKVAGIVSTDPAHLMNSSQEGVPLALAGRVPCKVTGTVNAGDLMVSAGNGLARAEANPAIGTVIGKAIEDFSGEGEGVIEVLALMM